MCPYVGLVIGADGFTYIITQNALEPLHAQFDYLKNTVSVCNDYYQSFKNYKVKADVYDLNSKKVFSYSQRIDIGEDEVLNDLFKIVFLRV